MALSTIGRNQLNTGIDDNSDATAVTIDSSERVGVGTASPAASLTVDCGAPGGTDKTISEFQAESSRKLGFVWDDSASTLGLATLSNNALAFHINGNSTEKMRIDTSGRVTTPNQPSCLIRMSNVSGIDATGQIALGNGYWQAPSGGAFDNGSNFSTSTGRFTAPVTGYYHFTHHMRVDAANGSYLYTSILENNNDLVSRDLRSISTSYQTLHNSGNAYLAANDYLYVNFHVVGDSSVNIDSDSFFSCFLIG